jgi:hypothetical protein
MRPDLLLPAGPLRAKARRDRGREDGGANNGASMAFVNACGQVWRSGETLAGNETKVQSRAVRWCGLEVGAV